MSTELERIALLAARLGQPTTGVGIGDDAAVLEPIPDRSVWTIDAQVEGTHFRLDWLSWEAVGWRTFMAASSDLAAMGAVPLAALSALILDAQVDDAALSAFADGQAMAARVVGAPVVGGNLARGRETSITTTLLGRATHPILRSGARPGDGVWVAGRVGMAAAGLAALQRGIADASDPSVAACVDAWRRPLALVELGLAMLPSASAAVDISDGLARDAGHIASASGVTLTFDEGALRAHGGPELASVAARCGCDALDWILGGGEDYALLACSPSPIDGFVRIGDVERGPASVILCRTGGARTPVDGRGYDHFG